MAKERYAPDYDFRNKSAFARPLYHNANLLQGIFSFFFKWHSEHNNALYILTVIAACETRYTHYLAAAPLQPLEIVVKTSAASVDRSEFRKTDLSYDRMNTTVFRE